MFEPVLTPTMHPSPQVRVDFDSLHASTARITVHRSKSVSATVRDAEDAYAAGGFTIVDYEVPLGVHVGYWAEMFDASGNSLGLTGTTETILYGEQGYGWFSNPLSPGDALEVVLDAQFGESLSRSRPMQLHRVGNSTIALMGSIGLLEGVNLTCKTYRIEDADRLSKILASSLILVRTTPRIRIPSALYVAASQFAEVEQDVQFGGEWIVWPLQGDEVTPSTISAAAPAYPYQTYMDAFATYAEAELAYATYLDAMKNPPGA